MSQYIRDISHSYFVSKYRLKKIINIDDADNLTSDVYLSFAEQYHKIENIENWLRRVMFLTFIRWYKKNRAMNVVELNENVENNNDIQPQADAVDVEAMLKIIDTLSDDKQKIIRLRFWGDLKFQEIANNMNRSEAAVKKMFYRTIAELKKMIE